MSRQLLCMVSGSQCSLLRVSIGLSIVTESTIYLLIMTSYPRFLVSDNIRSSAKLTSYPTRSHACRLGWPRHRQLKHIVQNDLTRQGRRRCPSTVHIYTSMAPEARSSVQLPLCTCVPNCRLIMHLYSNQWMT